MADSMQPTCDRPGSWRSFLEHGQSPICFLELLAALCLLLTFKELLRSRRVYFFVDNTPAGSCMINGFSRPVETNGRNGQYLPSRKHWPRPVFKQVRMLLPSPADCLNPARLIQGSAYAPYIMVTHRMQRTRTQTLTHPLSQPHIAHSRAEVVGVVGACGADTRVLPPLLSGSDGFSSRTHHTRQDE